MLFHGVIKITMQIIILDVNGFKSLVPQFVRVATANACHHNAIAKALSIDPMGGKQRHQAGALVIDGQREPAFLVNRELAYFIWGDMIGQPLLEPPSLPKVGSVEYRHQLIDLVFRQKLKKVIRDGVLAFLTKEFLEKTHFIAFARRPGLERGYSMS